MVYNKKKRRAKVYGSKARVFEAGVEVFMGVATLASSSS